MTDAATADPQSPALLKAWEEYAAAVRRMFEQPNDGTSVPGGVTPFEFLGAWKDFAENLGLRTTFLPGEQFKPESVFAGLLPALGISREYQEIGRRMQEISVQFQRRYAEFAQQGIDIGQHALQAFQKRISGGKPPQPSPSALYDAWIDSAEEAYARAAHGEPFARLLADLCNLVSAFKVERGKLLEALARHLDWPSRSEVDSLHRRVRALASAAKAPPPPRARRPKVRKPKAPGSKATGSKPPGSKPSRPSKRAVR